MQKMLPYRLRVALILISLLLTGLLSSCDSGGPTYPSIVPDDALEPNNTREEATEIELDYQAELVLQDSDWFKFTLAEEMFLGVLVKTPENAFSNVYARVYDGASAPVDFDFGRGDVINSFHQLLPAGDYYLELSGFVESDTRKYNVSISATALPDVAYEPNNTSQTASKVELNAGAQKMFLGGKDEDWYTFTLDEPQIVTVTLDEGNSDHSYTFKRAFYNGSFEMYDDGRGDYQYGIWNTLTVGLEPGTYYVRAYRDQEYASGGATYSLGVSSVPIPDKAVEPNDASRTATKVELNAEAREMFLRGEGRGLVHLYARRAPNCDD